MEADELVEIYTTNDAGEAELMKLALQEEGIKSMIDGENQAGLAGILPIRVMVQAWEADKARSIVSSADRKFHDHDDSGDDE